MDDFFVTYSSIKSAADRWSIHTTETYPIFSYETDYRTHRSYETNKSISALASQKKIQVNPLKARNITNHEIVFKKVGFSHTFKTSICISSTHRLLNKKMFNLFSWKSNVKCQSFLVIWHVCACSLCRLQNTVHTLWALCQQLLILEICLSCAWAMNT